MAIEPKPESAAEMEPRREPVPMATLSPEISSIIRSLNVSAAEGPLYNPVYDKVDGTHISQALTFADKQDERDLLDRNSARRYTLFYLLIFAALFAFVTVFLVNADKELYKEALKLLAVFLGGFGGGYGYKAYKEKQGAE